MAHDKGLLSSPEYAVMCQWYEFIEKNVDIGLDLIGKCFNIFYYFIVISFFCINTLTFLLIVSIF